MIGMQEDAVFESSTSLKLASMKVDRLTLAIDLMSILWIDQAHVLLMLDLSIQFPDAASRLLYLRTKMKSYYCRVGIAERFPEIELCVHSQSEMPMTSE